MSTATLVHREQVLGPIASPFIAAARLPDPFTLVIFGANGDLSARKLMPAIYGLKHSRIRMRRRERQRRSFPLRRGRHSNMIVLAESR